MTWPFDQVENAAAITTKQAVNGSLPVLVVVHYEDDHSWAFTCGTTNNTEDAQLVSMAQIIKLDPTLHSIADLPPGWRATRDSVNAEWIRVKNE